jgi:YhgE/Pip-like protein
MSHSSPGARRRAPDPRLPVRAGRLLRVRAIWVTALAVGSLVVAAMTALYIASTTDPLAHLSGLPVAVVDQDQGAAVGAQRIDIGQQIEGGLLAAPAVTDRLRLEKLTLPQAEQAMDRDALYATLVIPPGLTANLLTATGLAAPGERPGAVTAAPQLEIFINQRAGTVGTSLATGILQPALAVASRQIGRRLAPLVPAGSAAPATRLLLADPLPVTVVQYRPLPNNAGLALTPFYIALLTLLCGFIGGGIVNSVVDSALGYASTDLGPRWRQRQPVPINRWQTLLDKWGVIAVAAAVLTAVMLLVAWGVGMDMPWPWLLWVFTWLCALSVGIGTIALFAMAGNYGQLIGLLIFVYAGLASAGGTVPVEALPGFLRALSYVEPLRQVIEGTRSILYFNAQGVAGLTRGTVAAAAGLVFWLVVGGFVVRWYDRRGFYRLRPEILAHVNQSVQDFHAKEAREAEQTEEAAPAPAPAPANAESSDPARPPSGETGPGGSAPGAPPMA